MRLRLASLLILTLCLSGASDAQGAIVDATYFGKGTDWWPYAIQAVRIDDELYVSGVVRNDYPLTGQWVLPGLPGGAQEVPSGVNLGDLFVSRLTADLSTVLQTTYYGGIQFSNIVGLHVTENAVFIVGTTDSLGPLPATEGAAQPAQVDDRNAFVARLSRDLRVIERSSFFGGSQEEWAFASALGKDCLYVAGLTGSTDLPNTQGGAQPTNASQHASAFVVRFDLGLTQANATYLGSEDSFAQGLAVWGSDVYVTGTTTSDFPGVQGGVQEAFAGGPFGEADAFVARLDGHLQFLLQSTHLGGFGSETGESIAVTQEGVFFLGSTRSSNFPFTAAAAQPQIQGAEDAVLVHLDHSLTGSARATYLNAPDGQRRYHGLFAHGQTVYVGGASAWPDLPAIAGAVQELPGGKFDAFVTALTVDLDQVIQSTYFGGSGYDSGFHLAGEVSGEGTLKSVYMAGVTASPDLPHTIGGAQHEIGFERSGFVVRLPASLRE